MEHVKLVGHLILPFFVQADKLGAEIFFLEIIWDDFSGDASWIQ